MSGAHFLADTLPLRTLLYMLAFLSESMRTGIHIMEQGFPPIETQPVDWVILAGLVLACLAFIIQWRWKPRRGRTVMMFLWTSIFGATWLAAGQLMYRQFAPDWTWYVRSGLLFAAPITMMLIWLDGDPRPRPRWQRVVWPPVGAVLVFGVLAILTIGGHPPEAFRRTQCRNNLKQLGLALHIYHDSYAAFPDTAAGNPPISWRVALLPYVDQRPLFERYDPLKRWDETPNSDFLIRREANYHCPSQVRPHDEAGRYFTSYVAPVGSQTVLGTKESRRIQDIPDGTSDTIALVEACGLEILWTDPRDFDVTGGPVGINLKGHSQTDSPGLLSSYHRGGANVLMADGSVRFLSEKTDPAVLNALLTADGGEDVTGWE